MVKDRQTNCRGCSWHKRINNGTSHAEQLAFAVTAITMRFLSLVKNLRKERALIRKTTSAFSVTSCVIMVEALGISHGERRTTDIDFANIEALGSR